MSFGKQYDYLRLSESEKIYFNPLNTFKQDHLKEVEQLFRHFPELRNAPLSPERMWNFLLETEGDFSLAYQNQGVVYIAGRDDLGQPIIVINPSRIDYSQTLRVEIYNIICRTLIIAYQYMLIDGLVMKWRIVIDGEYRMRQQIDLGLLLLMVEKLARYFPSSLDNIYVIRFNNFINPGQKANLQQVIPEECMSKILFLEQEEDFKSSIIKKVRGTRLEMKFGGYLANQTKYWQGYHVPQAEEDTEETFELYSELEINLCSQIIFFIEEFLKLKKDNLSPEYLLMFQQQQADLRYKTRSKSEIEEERLENERRKRAEQERLENERKRAEQQRLEYERKQREEQEYRYRLQQQQQQEEEEEQVKRNKKNYVIVGDPNSRRTEVVIEDEAELKKRSNQNNPMGQKDYQYLSTYVDDGWPKRVPNNQPQLDYQAVGQRYEYTPFSVIGQSKQQRGLPDPVEYNVYNQPARFTKIDQPHSGILEQQQQSGSATTSTAAASSNINYALLKRNYIGTPSYESNERDTRKKATYDFEQLQMEIKSMGQRVPETSPIVADEKNDAAACTIF